MIIENEIKLLKNIFLFKSLPRIFTSCTHFTYIVDVLKNLTALSEEKKIFLIFFTINTHTQQQS